MESTAEYLIGVRLHASAQADDYTLGDLDVHVGDLVMVETASGIAIGEVRRPRRELPESKRGRAYPRVVRMAGESEAREYRERREREQRAIVTCQQMARGRGLQLKVVDVEMQPAARRVIVSFSAEARVDFRELVRDLAAHFRMRIEMRQIGVRDEAKMLGGYGSCGRPLCCTTWLNTFEPVSIKMAKQQQLSLNPSKLSGQCGRLKCCLRYELPNGNGVKHAGCADGGHCTNPTGCGTGGCGTCGSCGSCS